MVDPVDPKPRNDQWTWINGSPLEYSNWVSNQPDFMFNNGEFCGMMNRWSTEGLWNDGQCGSEDVPNYVCQL